MSPEVTSRLVPKVACAGGKISLFFVKLTSTKTCFRTR